MEQIRCEACGYRFETAAKSNRTRCGRCRSVVKVPLAIRRANGHVSRRSQPMEPAPVVLALQLACGHPSAFFGEEIRAADAVRYLWDCDVCGSAEQEVRRVLGALDEDESDRVFAEEDGCERWLASLIPPTLRDALRRWLTGLSRA